jgi:hypothetical protein
MAGGFAAAAVMTVGVAVGGFGYAAAAPGDFSTLPVDPNLITDSLAYNAAPPVFNPNGQPGVETVYTHREVVGRSAKLPCEQAMQTIRCTSVAD